VGLGLGVPVALVLGVLAGCYFRKSRSKIGTTDARAVVVTSDQPNVTGAYQQGTHEIDGKQAWPAERELGGNAIHEAP
jgi:hypothetical protein